MSADDLSETGLHSDPDHESWEYWLFQVGGIIISVIILNVIFCGIIRYRKAKAFKKLGYDFVKTTDSEFYSTDADVDNMSEIDIDGI